ncbi:MAG TPA: VWA domain-containing protein, partial [Ignavibacteria bacterium]|nr:VWA domain-containing protein [Ignavibacteria bacterium]
MVFLNPAILFGLIAAAIPVLLHFLNLQKLKRIEFSTLSFLKELQKTKIRKLKFKQWLLLALRILLIILIVSAFARPTLETFTIAGTSAAKSSTVFIIDDSFSMSVVKSNGSHFNFAKEIVKNILNDLQFGDEAVVLFSTERNNKKFTSNLNEIERELANANVSVKKQRFNEALLTANELLNSSKNFNKELFVLSDFSDQTLAEKITKQNLSFDENTKLYLFNFGDDEFSNRVVTDFQLNNQLLENGKSISFTTQIKNTKGSSVTNGVASLFLNGTRCAQQSFDLQENESKSILFETTLNNSGLVEAYVEIEQDDIIQDNKRFAAFLVPEKINVLLASDNRNDNRFVKIALASASEQTVANIKEINTSELSYNLNNNYDVIIIIGSKNISSTKELNNYIEQGGRVILFPGKQSEAADFQSFLAGLGVRTNISLIGEPNSTESISYFNVVEYEHPIFENLFEDRKDTKVESPEVYAYLKIMPQQNLRPVISLSDNSLFFCEFIKENGRLLVFNSAPVLGWNNFPVKSLFAPLINKSVLYQSIQKQSGKNIVAGESIDIKTVDLKLPQLKIVKPDNSEEFVNIEELGNHNYFTYNKTVQLGVYKFYSGNELMDYA